MHHLARPFQYPTVHKRKRIKTENEIISPRKKYCKATGESSMLHPTILASAHQPSGFVTICKKLPNVNPKYIKDQSPNSCVVISNRHETYKRQNRIKPYAIYVM